MLQIRVVDEPFGTWLVRLANNEEVSCDAHLHRRGIVLRDPTQAR